MVALLWELSEPECEQIKDQLTLYSRDKRTNKRINQRYIQEINVQNLLNFLLTQYFCHGIFKVFLFQQLVLFKECTSKHFGIDKELV